LKFLVNTGETIQINPHRAKQNLNISNSGYTSGYSRASLSGEPLLGGWMTRLLKHSLEDPDFEDMSDEEKERRLKEFALTELFSGGFEKKERCLE
jgi:hypothetical protein